MLGRTNFSLYLSLSLSLSLIHISTIFRGIYSSTYYSHPPSFILFLYYNYFSSFISHSSSLCYPLHPSLLLALVFVHPCFTAFLLFLSIRLFFFFLLFHLFQLPFYLLIIFPFYFPSLTDLSKFPAISSLRISFTLSAPFLSFFFSFSPLLNLHI